MRSLPSFLLLFASLAAPLAAQDCLHLSRPGGRASQSRPPHSGL
jgi:hypothetical protein